MLHTVLFVERRDVKLTQNIGDVMVGQRKKMVAALAAVSLYLQQEEAIAAQEQQVPPKRPQRFEFSEWGQRGRQEMMVMRKLIQL